MITNIQQATEKATNYSKIKSTVLVLDTNNEVIILQRSVDDENGGTWELPGGGIEIISVPTKEYLFEEAKREVLEEAGITVDSIEFAYMLEFTNPKGFLQGNYMFIAKIEGVFNPSISQEHSDYKIVTQNQAITDLSFDNHRNLVKFNQSHMQS